MTDRHTVKQLRFRLRQELLADLERAARAADRSLNEEVERRLERSFMADDVQRVIKQTVEATLRKLKGRQP